MYEGRREISKRCEFEEMLWILGLMSGRCIFSSRMKSLLVGAMLLCNYSYAENEVLFPPEDAIMSAKVTFSSGFTCDSVAIISQAFRDSVHFHMIIGSEHAGTTTLLTHRLCSAMQMGIKVLPYIILVCTKAKTRSFHCAKPSSHTPSDIASGYRVPCA